MQACEAFELEQQPLPDLDCVLAGYSDPQQDGQQFGVG